MSKVNRPNIILVHLNHILKCPPVMSVIHSIDNLGYDLTVITVGNNKDELIDKMGGLEHTRFALINEPFNHSDSVLKKMLRMPVIGKKTWDLIDDCYNDQSIIWVVDEITVKHLGNKLLERRYILHLLEVRESLVYSDRARFLKLDSHAFGSSALAVVTCEYNRAHITKALWKLDRVPFVLPNKPRYTVRIEKNDAVVGPKELHETMEALTDKKIVLYQGILSKERPLDKYIEAVDQLGEEYAFVLMSGDENPYAHIASKNYYYIPFVAPPNHLRITSHAHIGVLSYTADSLNTLYCAPNKIWEYAKFGVPMIGSDLPALNQQFAMNHMGECLTQDTVDSIKAAIEKIEGNYTNYSEGASRFYNSFDFESRVREIISWAENQ